MNEPIMFNEMILNFKSIIVLQKQQMYVDNLRIDIRNNS
jgi:hypothetical protein